MIINPKEIIEKGIIKNLEGGNFEVQQNGIDLTLGSVQKVKGGYLGKEERVINEYENLEARENGVYYLEEGVYSINFQQEIKVPEDMCAEIIQRSTLNRIGGFILAGLYDSGFNNQVGAILRVSSGLKIEKGARVAQIIFQDANPASLYKGIYQKA
jgi:dUTP pyrophosphatase